MYLGEEDHRGNMLLLSYPVNDTCYQHNLCLLMLTLISWGSGVCQGLLCEVTLQFPPFPYNTLWKEVTIHKPLLRDLCSRPVQGAGVLS